MTQQMLKKIYDNQEEEHPYFTVPPIIPTTAPPSSESPNWDGKVGEVLVRVKRMEEILVKMSNAMAAVKPQIPPKPQTDYRRMSSCETNLGKKVIIVFYKIWCRKKLYPECHFVYGDVAPLDALVFFRFIVYTKIHENINNKHT